MEKLQGIQILRGIAASLVLFNHLRVIEAKYFGGNPLLEGFMLGNSGVDLFFVISGFIIALVSKELFGSWRNALNFIKKRLIRVVPLYWFFSTFVLSVYLYNPAWVNSSAEAPPNILASYFFIPTGTKFLLLVGWTLAYEMYFYIVWSTLMMGKRGNALKILSVFFLCSVLVNLIFHFESPIFRLMTQPLILEFMLGTIICHLFLTVRIKDKVLLGLILVTGIVALASNLFVDYGVHRFFKYGLPAALIFFSVVFFEKNYDIPWPKLLVSQGDASYALYLSHVLVLSALGRIYKLSGWTEFMPSNLPLIIGFYIVCCMIGWLSYKWIELPLSRVLNRKLVRKPVDTEAVSVSIAR